MATRDDIYAAIKNADAAGDTDSVQKLGAYLKTMPQSAAPAPAQPPEAPSHMDEFVGGLKNFVGKNAVLGALEHAANIGATIMHPFQALQDKLAGTTGTNATTRSGIAGGINELGVDRNSLAYKNAGLATDIAGTSGVGGLLAKPVQAAVPLLETVAPTVAQYVQRGANALSSGGFTTGAPAGGNLLQRGGDMLLRVGGGAANGAASTGLIDPNSAGTGAIVGGILPPAMKVVGTVAAPIGAALGKAITGGSITPEVQALAKRAQELGIQLPADRIANSKPLNAVAAGLNYVPLSGRAAVEDRMQDQLNSALTRTFGQDSPNVTMALRKAQGDLGSKFDSILQNNTVKVDPQFMSDLADASNKAQRELGTDGASIIGKQVDDIVSKAGTGEIDGQAAYNIKKTLDRIGSRNSPEAYYALDLKKALMGALDRSLGPEEASAFAQTRKQYGNMLDLQKLAQNGADGDVSIARVANLKNIGNPDLQELADISAQFLKPREGQHGAAQRAFAGMGLAGAGHLVGGLAGGAVGLGGTMVAGRAANAALDSQMARNLLMQGPEAAAPELTQIGNALYRGAPRSVQNGTR